MAGQRIDIMELRELPLLKQQGLSNRKAAKHLSVSRNTVNSYVKIFEAYHLEYGELLELNDTELAELFPAVSEVEENRYTELAKVILPRH
jgi:transposase